MMAADKRQWKKPDLNQQVTDCLLNDLAGGGFLWESDGMAKGIGRNVAPYNAISGQGYHGWNQLFLAGVAAAKSGDVFDPRFCTFKQASDQGWRIKKGSVSSKIMLFKPVLVSPPAAKDEETTSKKGRLLDKLNPGKTVAPSTQQTGTDGRQEGRRVWLLRAFSVFHASQIDGIPALNESPLPWNGPAIPGAMREALIADGLRIIEGDSMVPAYDHSNDMLTLPSRENFGSSVEFDSALIAGLALATAHASRMPLSKLESDQCARDQMIADFTAAMVCGQVGIGYSSPFADVRDDWISLLEADKKLGLKVAGMAGRISEYLIRCVPDLAVSMVEHRQRESNTEMAIADSVDLESFDLSSMDLDIVEVEGWIEAAGADAEVIDLSIFDVKPDLPAQSMRI